MPQEAVLGKANQGFLQLMDRLPFERLAVAVTATAHCEFMYEETRNYIKQRQAFGKTLDKLQVRGCG